MQFEITIVFGWRHPIKKVYFNNFDWKTKIEENGTIQNC